jgi:hypothetical protein
LVPRIFHEPSFTRVSTASASYHGTEAGPLQHAYRPGMRAPTMNG